MWYKLCMSFKADPDFVRSATELLQSTSRNLFLVTGSVYLAWYLVAVVACPYAIGWNALLVGLVVALTFTISLLILPIQLLAAQAIWQV